MSFFRNLDDRVLDVFQGVVAKVHVRHGLGKNGLMRDVHLACGLFCTVAVVGALFRDPMFALLAFIFFLPQAFGALLRARLAKVEHEPASYRKAILKASLAREEQFKIRVLELVLLCLFATVFLGFLIVVGLGAVTGSFVREVPFLLLPTFSTPIVTNFADVVEKYLDACVPPPPGSHRAETAWSGRMANSTSTS